MGNAFEPKITLAYWKSLKMKGKLYLEYPAAKLGYTDSKRRIDGIVVIDQRGDKKGHLGKDAPDLKGLKGKSVLLIQTKRKKLGMGLAGQAIVTKKLFEIKKVCVRASVALCREDDADISRVLKKLGCKTEIYRAGWAKSSNSNS